jgi:outer membrane lipoprotein SlyB
MKYSTVLAMTLAIVATAVFTGCVESQSGNVFSRDEARQAAEVYAGTVIDVREGQIEGSQSGVGAIGGGAMGGAVGSTIGGGSGNVVATVGGAVVGAIVGNAVEKGVTGARALQITVRLDVNGKEIQVVQGTDIPFAVGQRVRVITQPGGRSRVQPL